MAPKSWATARQRNFMETRIPEFQNAQRSTTTTVFFSNFYTLFFAEWKSPQEELADFVQENAAETNKKKKKKSVQPLDQPTDQPTSQPSLLLQGDWETLRRKVRNF